MRYSWYSRSGTGSRYCRVAAGLSPAGVAARRGPAGGPRRCVYERPLAIEIGTRSGSHSAVPALCRRSDLDECSTAAVRNSACTEHCGPLKFARTCTHARTHARNFMHAQPAGARSHDRSELIVGCAQPCTNWPQPSSTSARRFRLSSRQPRWTRLTASYARHSTSSAPMPRERARARARAGRRRSLTQTAKEGCLAVVRATESSASTCFDGR